MGMGTGLSSNQVYFDNATGRYYTINPFMGITTNRNYLDSNPLTSNNANSNSMVTSGMERAQKAYDAALAGMNANPAYNLSSLFPQMTSPNMGTPSTGTPNMGMYGAGRFLSPAAGQATGGVLGLDFSAPGTTT